tara:strand:- start:215 stop:538 length:324 start_codon:yes stop_codon:yes gene_type:complete
MNKKNKEKLLKKLKQRLEDSWSGFTQVIEEAEEFLEDIREAQENEFNVANVSVEYAEKNCALTQLEIFYEDYIDNLKFQAEGLQDETQQAIDKFEGMFNISYMKEEV